MEDAIFLVVVILVRLAFPVICCVIASNKGRNAAAWFFIGLFFPCIGLIIILCLSDLNDERARWNRQDRESRRLREQLRQERLKNEAVQDHVTGRLDHFDELLDVDTRQLGRGQAGGQIGFDSNTPPALPGEHRSRSWYVSINGQRSNALTFDQLKDLYDKKRINDEALVWCEGMVDWVPITEVPGLIEELL